MTSPAPILCALLLCACTTDPNAGMVAARITGQSECAWFSNGDRLESAALFPFRGQWWGYIAAVGSFPTTVPASQPAPFHLFQPGIVCKVLPEPKNADLLNGCLPRAIAEVRKKGGAVLVSGHHAERVATY